jgi:hypothetical protein
MMSKRTKTVSPITSPRREDRCGAIADEGSPTDGEEFPAGGGGAKLGAAGGGLNAGLPDGEPKLLPAVFVGGGAKLAGGGTFPPKRGTSGAAEKVGGGGLAGVPNCGGANCGAGTSDELPACDPPDHPEADPRSGAGGGGARGGEKSPGRDPDVLAGGGAKSGGAAGSACRIGRESCPKPLGISLGRGAGGDAAGGGVAGIARGSSRSVRVMNCVRP